MLIGIHLASTEYNSDRKIILAINDQLSGFDTIKSNEGTLFVFNNTPDNNERRGSYWLRYRLVPI